MFTFRFKHYLVELTQFINRDGNTSYCLDFFVGDRFVYRVVRYVWGYGSCYHLIADSDGWCVPAPVVMKTLVPGFNWSAVRRAYRAVYGDGFRGTYFPGGVHYGK